MKTTLAAASETAGESGLTEREGRREEGRAVPQKSPLCPSGSLCSKQFCKYKHLYTFTNHVIFE